MKQSTIDKIYKKIRNKHPEIQNEAQIEEIARKHIFRRKILIAISIYILSVLMGFLLGNGVIDKILENLDTKTHETIKAVFEMICGASAIVAVMVFANSLHDPLTPTESRELHEKETYEKTGRK